MNKEELKALEKSVRRKKRIASEKASAIHDLVEDRLWTEYDTLMDLSQETYDACVTWKEAEQELAQEQASTSA